METIKQLDLLNENGVSILTKRVIEVDGKQEQVGEAHRRAYNNSERGRQELIDREPQEVVNAVFALWGDEPTVIEETDDKEN